jgi:hypothetical protein
MPAFCAGQTKHNRRDPDHAARPSQKPIPATNATLNPEMAIR